MRDIRTELKKIQGTGFVKDVHSLVNIVAGISIVSTAISALSAIIMGSDRVARYIKMLLLRAKIILLDKTNDKKNNKI